MSADIPVFTVDLKCQLEPGLLAVGILDGSPSFAVVSQRRVLVHAPLSTEIDGRPQTRLINIHKEITAFAVGRFSKKQRRKIPGLPESVGAEQPECLFVASPESVKAIDIFSNADMYVADCADDGALSLTFGSYECYPVNPAAMDEPAQGSQPSDESKIGKVFRGVTIVGGRASIRVLDPDGSEIMWAPTPAPVAAVGLTPFNPPVGSRLAAALNASGATHGDGSGLGRNAIVAGCSDGSIVWFRGSYPYANVSVAQPITALVTLGQSVRGLRNVREVGGLVAFRTLDGTVGVASVDGVLWSRKTATVDDGAAPSVLTVCDLDGNGEAEVVVEGGSGLIALSLDGGAERWRVNTAGRRPIAVTVENLAERPSPQLIVAFADGGVSGYEIATPDDGALGYHSYDTQRAEAELAAVLVQHSTLAQQADRLQTLLDNRAHTPSRLPCDVVVHIAADVRGRLLVVATASGAYVHELIVQGVAIAGKGVDIVAVAAHDTAKPTLSVGIAPTSETPRNLTARVLVAVESVSPPTLTAVDLAIELPPFPAFHPVPNASDVPRPPSHVTFRFTDRPKRLLVWIQRTFPGTAATVSGDGQLVAAFRRGAAEQLATSGRSTASATEGATTTAAKGSADGGDDGGDEGDVIVIEMIRDEVTFRVDSMDIAGRLVQSLVAHFGLTSLTSSCSFPREFERLTATCDEVAELNTTRLRLAAQIASETDNVKALIVLAEDARLMRAAYNVRRNIVALSGINGSLMLDHKKRLANHAALMAALKRMNSYITLGAALRAGPPSHQVRSSPRYPPMRLPRAPIACQCDSSPTPSIVPSSSCPIVPSSS